MRRWLWIFGTIFFAVVGFGQSINTLNARNAPVGTTDAMMSPLGTLYIHAVLNAAQFSGSDIGAKVNAAGASCSWNCTVEIPAGSYSDATTIDVPLNTYKTFTLACSAGANIHYTGSGYWLDTFETGADPSGAMVTIQGCDVAGTVSAKGGIRVRPSNGVVIAGNILRQFTGGAPVVVAGANNLSVVRNTISYSLYGIETYPTKCLVSSPHTCSPTQSGTVHTYAVNALRVQANEIASNREWGYFDDQSLGTSEPSLNDVIENNVFEANGTAGSAYGGIQLSYGYGYVVENNYFESNPRNLVIGDGAHNVVGANIEGNYFTVSRRTPDTIEMDGSVAAMIVGNSEYGAGSTCFSNAVMAGHTYYGPNIVRSAYPYCVSGSPGNVANDVIANGSGLIKTTTVNASRGYEVNGSQISSSNLSDGTSILKYCGNSTFSNGTSGSTVSCSWVATSSRCEVTWRGTPPATAVNLGYTTASGKVTPRASAAVAGTVSVACSAK